MAFIPGFQLKEASDLIVMLGHLEGGDTPPLVLPPLPKNWQSVFESPALGVFDNKWQLMQNTDVPGQYAVLIRGTVDTPGSIFDDVLAVMIPANGSVFGHSYRFAGTAASSKQPGVHLGFALAALILLFHKDHGILVHLQTLTDAQDIYVAGHSQGAAIATILGSFFRYYTLEPFAKWNYKTYAFAQPKPGNDHYADDFNAAIGNPGLGIVVNNSEDWVPQVPFTLELLTDLNRPNPISVLEGALLAPLTGAVDVLYELAKKAHVDKQAGQIDKLAEVLHGQTIQPMADADRTFFPEIMLTLNFAGCGVPHSLLGTPGSNPENPKDFFWQHHTAMYYNLMNGITPPA